MILISDDGHDYVTKRGGGRALRLDRRLGSANSEPIKQQAQDNNNIDLNDDVDLNNNADLNALLELGPGRTTTATETAEV